MANAPAPRSVVPPVLLALVNVVLMAAAVLLAELGCADPTDVQWSLAAASAAAVLAGVAASLAAAGALHLRPVPVEKSPRRRRVIDRDPRWT